MFPEFQTERFLLLQIMPDDQPFIFEGLSHPQVIPHYGVQYKTLEETSAQMQYYSQLLRDGTGAWWKIVDRQTTQNLGAIGYNNYSASHRKCEVGYWLLPQHWGRGIAAETLQTVMSYLFREKQVHRIEALIELENVKSSGVAERAGFMLDGLLRDYEWKVDRFISLRLYSRLATD